MAPSTCFSGKMGIFQLFAMLVETGGWLPTTVRIWVGDYGMLKPPRSCCCRSFRWEKSWRRDFWRFWGWYVVAVDFQCQKANIIKIGRKTQPKDITVHAYAWMLLWFVWIEILGGLDAVEYFPKTFFSSEREKSEALTAGGTFQAGLWWLSCKSLSMNFRQWFDIRMMFPFAS